MSLSIVGASESVTDEGPPERIIPLGYIFSNASFNCEKGNISE
mgnify:CR=1 FL=1